MAATVGFLRAIKLAWMNKTIELVLENKEAAQIREELNEYLAFEIKSQTTLRKTREILMNAWVYQSDTLDAVRKAALTAYSTSIENRISLQYCVLLLAYPVVADVCGFIGKLSTIQETFTTAWLKEKMYEAWGERETIADSLKYILQTLKDFGVISSPKTGTHMITVRNIESMQAINVLLMTILHLNGKTYREIADLTNVSYMFPFRYSVSLEWLHNSTDYVLNNYGGKMTLALK